MKVINKITASILIIMMMLLNSMALAVENATGTVNTETLRLRKDPSTESIVLDLLSKDDKVEILEEKGEWYKIKFKDYTGYVSKEFISKSGEIKETDSQSSTDQGTIKIKDQVAITNTDVKVYILPLINSNVVADLKQNTNVTIVNIAGGWAYINSNEVSGWIRLDKLSISESTNSESNTSEPEQNNQANINNMENKNEINKSEDSKKKEFASRNAYINASAANIRHSASTTSQVIITLSQNAQIKLVGEENDWYKIEVNNKTGYILKTLVSDKKVVVTSRSATQTRDTAKNEVVKQENTENNEIKTQEKKTQNTSSKSSSSKGEEVVAYAKKYLGCKYVYGGSGPSVFDCSGFTMYVYKHFGYSMGHSAVTQARIGKYVPRNNLQVGDLVIFNNMGNTSIGHVGIYVGGGNFIHASSGSGKIVISSLSNAYYNTRYVTGRRIF